MEAGLAVTRRRSRPLTSGRGGFGVSAGPFSRLAGTIDRSSRQGISTSSTALQALSDAVLYLTSYPYECSEQLASRILAVAALRDVLTAFQAEGLPPPADIEAAVKRLRVAMDAAITA